jgi:hypothetical protein
MWRVYLGNNPWTAPWYGRLQGRPPWVLKAALLAAILVVMVPLAVLVAAAVVVGVAVFALLSLAAATNALLRVWVDRLLHGRPTDGRRNVRVLGRGAE